MKNNPENKKIVNFRCQTRTKSQENASVEFKPGNDSMVYHFKLKDFSSEGFGILVRKDSNVLKHIKKGDVLSMVYHPENVPATPVAHHTEIKHISEPETGRYHGHLVVGLLILE